MRLNDITVALPQLKPDELRQVQTLVQFLLGNSSEKSTGQDGWLLSALAEELRVHGMGSFRPPERKVRDALAEAETALLLGVRSKSGATCAALGHMAARALTDWLKVANVSIRPKTVFDNAHNVIAAVEASFPGYRKARMLGMAVGSEIENGGRRGASNVPTRVTPGAVGLQQGRRR